jgi:hypothetical protein
MDLKGSILGYRGLKEATHFAVIFSGETATA